MVTSILTWIFWCYLQLLSLLNIDPLTIKPAESLILVDDIEINYFGCIRSSSEGKIVLDCNISSSALLTPAMRGLSLLSAAPLHSRSKLIHTNKNLDQHISTFSQ